jgi:hypothetical protein
MRAIEPTGNVDPTPEIYLRPIRDPARSSGTERNRVQGHPHRIPRTGHPRQSPIRHARPVRLALRIVEHEGNEMMRPYRIGPVQPGEPG